MIATNNNIERVALRWYGGKYNLAEWIISYLPEAHQEYIEPCAGGLAVLLQKPRSPLEIVNDLDGEIVNYFQVLRDRPDDLIRALKLTPWARDEYMAARRPMDCGPVEQARRFWVRCWMSVGGMGKWAGFRMAVDRKNDPAFEMHEYDYLYAVAERLMGVQIENRDAIELIEKCNNEKTLIYFDPPYIKETRSHKNEYHVDADDEFHFLAAGSLRRHQGYVVISGYACDLYAELYEAHGWQRYDKEAQTNSGGKRIESLWLSPQTVEALRPTDSITSLPLFAGLG